VDHRTDLFALGAVLYEMVTGRPAFAGFTAHERLEALLASRRHPSANATPRTSRTKDEQDSHLVSDLEAVIRRLLEKDPRRRYQSVLDLAFHLEQVSRRASRPPAPQSRRRPLRERALP
jgi:serine/threonine protein kinase